MKVSCAVLLLAACKLKGYASHPVKGVEYGFSTHGRFWQKPLEGSESGGYLTSKISHLHRLSRKFLDNV